MGQNRVISKEKYCRSKVKRSSPKLWEARKVDRKERMKEKPKEYKVKLERLENVHAHVNTGKS